jgi:hypothetical protein
MGPTESRVPIEADIAKRLPNPGSATGSHPGRTRTERLGGDSGQMRFSRLVGLPLSGVLLLTPVLATPAFAAGHHTARTTSHGSAAAHHTAKVHRVPFNAVGTVTGLDATASTITVAVHSGTRGLRGTTVTATVTSNAHIVADDTAITLTQVAVGSTVTIGGTRAGTTFTATRILVH